MNHKPENIIIPAITALALWIGGCSSPFDPDIDDTPVAVLNVLAEPDSVLTASVTHSWAAVGYKPDVTVTDAEVTFTVNGGERHTMTFNKAISAYVSDYRVREGDLISVSAHTPAYGDAAGATVVPRAVPIDNLTYAVNTYVDYNTMVVSPGGTITHPKRVDITYRITFTDPAGTTNYYMLGNEAECEDQILSENETPLDFIFSKYHDYAVFSDRSIEGRSYTLTCTTSYLPYGLRPGRLVDTIRFYTLSDDLYFYLFSLYRKYNGFNGSLEDMGLADPKSIFTNVSPGIGIVAARSAVVMANDVTDIVLEGLEIEH